ncbi:MAG: T9SS type A sorting domain-containing protein, partial [Candidatus Latescibacteria bacterium]|nr:T9SS type A sorting domain-containing protein [bacterium]MBD3423380.1 T9SS type A sorting domain-containing protein [Candidatus Latescibacterota bacterium]
HGTPGSGGPTDNNTGYIAPLHTDLIDHDIIYEYEYTLILGDLYDDIRSYVYSNAPEPGPDFVFDRDRQHCLPGDLSDTSPPYSGFWRLTLDSADPKVILPYCRWQACEVPAIYITCAHHTASDQAELFFAGAEGTFSSDRRLTIPVVPDGEVRTYEVDLSLHPLYTGVIKRLRFDPIIAQTAGDVVDLYAITTEQITSAEPERRSIPAPSLGPVVPNPFNPATTISFYLPNESTVSMTVYDTAGRKVRTLINGMIHAGQGEVIWDGRSDAGRPAASGIYYCRLEAGGRVQSRKLVLLR